MTLLPIELYIIMCFSKSFVIQYYIVNLVPSLVSIICLNSPLNCHSSVLKYIMWCNAYIGRLNLKGDLVSTTKRRSYCLVTVKYAIQHYTILSKLMFDFTSLAIAMWKLQLMNINENILRMDSKFILVQALEVLIVIHHSYEA